MPVAAMDRKSCMRREGRKPVAAMDRKSCMRREGRDARSRPAQAGIQWLIESIAAWPGMTIH